MGKLRTTTLRAGLLALLVVAIATAMAMAPVRASQADPAGIAAADWPGLEAALRTVPELAAFVPNPVASTANADGEAFDWFGSSIAVDGDTALIGVPRDDVGPDSDRGSAYVFERSGDTWTLARKLVADDGDVYDGFGVGVALDAEVALVGAPGAGAVYAFERASGDWNQQRFGTLQPGFGGTVALAGDTAWIGVAVGYLTEVHVYRHVGGDWVFTQQLTPDPASFGYFGNALALGTDLGVVAARGEDGGAGAVYVFERGNDGLWSRGPRLVASDRRAGDQFGSALALLGDVIAVGATQEYASPAGNGAVYLYRREGDTWTQQPPLVAVGGAPSDQFGAALLAHGGRLAVGAPGRDIDRGAAYVFEPAGDGWQQVARLVNPAPSGRGHLGRSLASAGESLLVGAPLEDLKANQMQGTVLEFRAAAQGWNFARQLNAGDGAGGDGFALALAATGETALVGARGADARRGVAYVMQREADGWIRRQTLRPSTSDPLSVFGSTVAMTPDVAVIGAAGGDAFVFARNGDEWIQQATIGPGIAGPYAVGQVAIDGDTAVVTMPYEPTGGAAYVYRRGGGSWLLEARLEATPSVPDFGRAVGIAGDVLVVGAPSSGRVVVFEREGSAWSGGVTLQPAASADGDDFGYAVAVTPTYLLIGSPGSPAAGYAGAAYVFERDATGWQERALLTGPGASPGARFGDRVVLRDDRAAVGASQDRWGAEQLLRGSVYLFERRDLVWQGAGRVRGEDVSEGFGSAVALVDDGVLVGAWTASPDTTPYANPSEGAFYDFRATGLLFADGFD